MRLLVDENLSASLLDLIGDLFSESVHVSSVAGTGAADGQIWKLAQDGGFAIISKDNDFRQRSFLEGAPPKIIWLSVGNAGTAMIASLIRQRYSEIEAFDRDVEASLLVVTP